mmetsp:Transcript_5064/g.14693  ORF Transcript_5064/g.14693 Transcript_5064/m.14693 type:complete len:279 (+) Transcript_5064:687-1523(+)
MLQERIQNTSHAKRRFNNRGSKFGLVNLFRGLLPADHFLCDLKSIDNNLSVGLESFCNRFKVLPALSQVVECPRYSSCVLLENHPNLLSVEFQLGDLDFLGSIVLDSGNHRCVGCLGVDIQIVTGTIGVANAFNPTIAGLYFQIPTVGGVVSHFSGQVLSETKPFRVHSDLFHVQLGSSHKVSQCFVVHQTDFYGFTNLQSFGFTSAQLIVATKQYEFFVSDGSKIRMRFVVGVYKMLNFSHAKFSNTKETTARSNFISETKSNLSGGKRHLLGVQVQ